MSIKKNKKYEFDIEANLRVISEHVRTETSLKSKIEELE